MGRHDSRNSDPRIRPTCVGRSGSVCSRPPRPRRRRTRSSTGFGIRVSGPFDIGQHWGDAERLIQASDGYLYGTTYWGGTTGVGTIFGWIATGSLDHLHSFAFADGANPAASLVQAADGRLYGTATRGGASNSAPSSGWTSGCRREGRRLRWRRGQGPAGRSHRGRPMELSTAPHTREERTTTAPFSRWICPGPHHGPQLRPHYRRSQPGRCTLAGVRWRLLRHDGGRLGIPSTVFGRLLGHAGHPARVRSSMGRRLPYPPLIQASDGNLYGTAARAARTWGPFSESTRRVDFAVLHTFDPSTEAPGPTPLDPGRRRQTSTAPLRAAPRSRPGNDLPNRRSGDLECSTDFDGTDGSSSQTALLQATDGGGFYGTTTTARRCVLEPLFPSSRAPRSGSSRRAR